MPTKIPRSPFTTRLSGSATETELRLRNIFQWKKKRPPIPLFILTIVAVMSCFGLVSCESKPETPPAADADEVLTLTTADGRTLTVELHLILSPQYEDYFSLTKMEVWDGADLIQTIDPTALPQYEAYLFEQLFVLRGRTMGEPIVQDMNFDGSEDFGLPSACPLPNNVPYRYFLWDEDLAQFVFSFTMCNIPTVDVENQLLIEEYTDGVTRYYKVENNYPVMLKETQWEGAATLENVTTEANTVRDLLAQAGKTAGLSALDALTLDEDGQNDDAFLLSIPRDENGNRTGEIRGWVLLGNGTTLEFDLADGSYVSPDLMVAHLTNPDRQSVIVQLPDFASTYGAAQIYFLEVQSGELVVLDYNSTWSLDTVVRGVSVAPRPDSELSCVRIPTLADKWHSPEWNTLIWENGQWKNVPDGYFTDTYTLTVDGGMELTLSLCGRHGGESYWYYDQAQILHGETVLQTITEGSFTPDTHCPFEYFNADTAYHKVLAYDINFDGNTDFGIPCNSTHNDGHVWFLYDPQTRQYRFAFSLAGVPTIDEENKQITEEWWDDSVYITYNTYEYNAQGQLTLVDSRMEQ